MRIDRVGEFEEIIRGHHQSDTSTLNDLATLIVASQEKREKGILKILKDARNLYDVLSMSSLEIACKYGDGFELPNVNDCLEMRKNLEQAINNYFGEKD